jgi:hypothetical protein
MSSAGTCIASVVVAISPENRRLQLWVCVATPGVMLTTMVFLPTGFWVMVTSGSVAQRTQQLTHVAAVASTSERAVCCRPGR